MAPKVAIRRTLPFADATMTAFGEGVRNGHRCTKLWMHFQLPGEPA